MDQKKTRSHEMAGWVSVITRYQKTYLWFVNHCGDFFEEGRHLSGQAREWMSGF